VQADAVAEVDPAVPADSGEGRRIVFSQGDQRVWLVGDDGTVERTYPVSGSRFDNLDPGSYRVQSKTRNATAFDASGTMEYFVRFATGYSEPIGFHSVPRDTTGKLEQTKAQLGTPLSAGCVRQWKNDAIALWDFAPVGTPVAVTP
jgi:lipoprotein-anchoring transpeptidase ErfK/SrfK